MAQAPETIKRAELERLKAAADSLERQLSACQVVAEDNNYNWWEPLCSQPVDKISPTVLAANAKEGADRAEGARILLEKSVEAATTLSRAIHRLVL